MTASELATLETDTEATLGPDQFGSNREVAETGGQVIESTSADVARAREPNPSTVVPA
jgi:hypothetical protein